MSRKLPEACEKDSFARQLERAIAGHGLGLEAWKTQDLAQIAERTSSSPETLDNYLRGERLPPSHQKLMRLLDAVDNLNIDPARDGAGETDVKFALRCGLEAAWKREGGGQRRARTKAGAAPVDPPDAATAGRPPGGAASP